MQDLYFNHKDNPEVKNWDFVELGYNDTRIYYDVNEKKYEKSGFNFMVIECIAYYNGAKEFDDDSAVQVIYWGYCSFDGIRHMHMGHEQSDNENYQHYVNCDQNILIFQKLKELTTKYCSDV